MLVRKLLELTILMNEIRNVLIFNFQFLIRNSINGFHPIIICLILRCFRKTIVFRFFDSFGKKAIKN